ncbi:hypothetical protein GCM10009544_29820 [Streptomyces stramineus]|uniref:Uncharacterized protein n=1 Tax=Streptomyces stramineus TaxID=173861 RepID=A0ABP3JVU7_9ACTN
MSATSRARSRAADFGGRFSTAMPSTYPARPPGAVALCDRRPAARRPPERPAGGHPYPRMLLERTAHAREAQ